MELELLAYNVSSIYIQTYLPFFQTVTPQQNTLETESLTLQKGKSIPTSSGDSKTVKEESDRLCFHTLRI